MISVSVLRDEKGAVLITGLVLLLLLTLLGVLSMKTTTMQEKMAGNLEQQGLAFQAAEAGLRDAESWLKNTVILPAFDNTNGLYTPVAVKDPPDPPRWREVDWTTDGGVIKYKGTDLKDPLPCYIIEKVASTTIGGNDSLKFTPLPEDKQDVFRVTSRGVSPNGRGAVMLQTTFIR